jgi:hypothetical protein
MSAETNPACSRCNDGWICETHPDCGWPHDDCAGPGVCPRLLLLRLRSSRRLQVLINCPDMTADRAAKKPALNSKLLGERHYASLNIPTLRAGKRTRGHISHIYEEVGTHDESPSLTAARHAPVLGQAAAGYPGSATNMRIFKERTLSTLPVEVQRWPFKRSRTCDENFQDRRRTRKFSYGRL